MVCVTRGRAGVDNVEEQRKLEARKMLENAAESSASSARFVGQIVGAKTKLHQASRIFRMLRNRVRSLRLNRSIAREKACVPILSE